MMSKLWYVKHINHIEGWVMICNKQQLIINDSRHIVIEENGNQLMMKRVRDPTPTTVVGPHIYLASADMDQ